MVSVRLIGFGPIGDNLVIVAQSVIIGIVVERVRAMDLGLIVV